MILTIASVGAAGNSNTVKTLFQQKHVVMIYNQLHYSGKVIQIFTLLSFPELCHKLSCWRFWWKRTWWVRIWTPEKLSTEPLQCVSRLWSCTWHLSFLCFLKAVWLICWEFWVFLWAVMSSCSSHRNNFPNFPLIGGRVLRPLWSCSLTSLGHFYSILTVWDAPRYISRCYLNLNYSNLISLTHLTLCRQITVLHVFFLCSHTKWDDVFD